MLVAAFLGPQQPNPSNRTDHAVSLLVTVEMAAEVPSESYFASCPCVYRGGTHLHPLVRHSSCAPKVQSRGNLFWAIIASLFLEVL